MKAILLSDTHLINENPIGRLDDVTETQWEKLSYIFDYAVKNKIEHVLQAGDLTDIRRSWELLQMLFLFLRKYQNVKLYFIKGQHCSYYHDITNDKTITGELHSSGVAQLLASKPINIGGGVYVYGASYGEEVPEVNTCGTNILVIHKQILTSKVYAKQEDYVLADQFLKEHNAFDLILCGDVHQNFIKQQGKRIICNTGPMLRLEASEMMFKHKPVFFVYDTNNGNIKSIDIPHAVANSVLSREHLNKQKERKQNFDNFIAQVRELTNENNSVSFEKNLEIIMKKNKTSKGVRAMVIDYLSNKEEK